MSAHQRLKTVLDATAIVSYLIFISEIDLGIIRARRLAMLLC